MVVEKLWIERIIDNRSKSFSLWFMLNAYSIDNNIKYRLMKDIFIRL